ncbi:hypothetical protein FIBSPDRAFT_899983 [Athelia psychrophila]|uniref:Uncharacterized protein n=1 Tax=Athelia psychrophila TaxID=1759441 RepID=A0A165Z068_9AGAM|nr:hypothetical protein FIBSPDRAFT_899983 [Fibularhizoctonia sp. CBS 109695]
MLKRFAIQLAAVSFLWMHLSDIGGPTSIEFQDRTVLRPDKREVQRSLELSNGSILDGGCQKWEPTQCSSELWVVLDLDDPSWRSYSKFTLRVSWPAYSPASFTMNIYSPDSMPTWFAESPSSAGASPGGKMTRRKYAHITAVEETGIPLSGTLIAERVDFRIILEPLVLGVLPASLQSTVATIALFGFLASLVVPRINRYLEKLAVIAREEIRRTKEE